MAGNNARKNTVGLTVASTVPGGSQCLVSLNTRVAMPKSHVTSGLHYASI